jgi:hypothetical protein
MDDLIDNVSLLERSEAGELLAVAAVVAVVEAFLTLARCFLGGYFVLGHGNLLKDR